MKALASDYVHLHGLLMNETSENNIASRYTE